MGNYYNVSIAITITIFFTLFTTRATAHSNLGDPLAYNPVACKGGKAWCKGVCPNVWKSGKNKARNSVQKPAVVWKRGQTVEIIWHKNNHVGGFYRRSLVPVQHMFEPKYHKLGAFDYGCWQQGVFQCGQNPKCGADLKGRAYKNKVKIPSVFPDGNYVLAQVWFGGLHRQGGYPKYSDYFSCSFVKIQGGAPLVTSAAATFTGPEMKCSTGATRPLQCDGESCGDKCGLEKCPDDSVSVTVPDDWKDGKVPKIFLANIAPDAKAGENEPETAAEKKKAVVEEKKIAVEEQKMVEEVPVAVEEKTTMKEEKKDMMNDMKEGKEEATQPLPDEYMKGPLKSLRVFVDNVMERELIDTDKATISLDGKKSITFEGYTDGKKVGIMYFKINGKNSWKESRPPYVFQGKKGTMYNDWKNPIIGKEFQLELVLWSKKKRFSISTLLTLTK